MPVIAGVILALSAEVPQLATIASVINAMTGGLEPAVLINAGLVGIGMRAAV